MADRRQLLPTDDELRERIKALLPSVNLQSTGVKAFMRLLSADMGGEVDLQPKLDFIRSSLVHAIQSQQQQQNTEEESSESESEAEEEEEIAPVKSKTSSTTPKRKRNGGGGGLAQRKEISASLADFLGQGNEMARTEIVKLLWEYIREHNLQNPDNRQEILLDGRMKEVFGCDKFTMFTMNKYIGAHIDPFTPVDLTTPSPKKARKKAATVKASSEKKKRKVGSQPPYRLSDPLQVVVGEPVLPRPQVVSKIWDYIKAHNLQNPSDKREILCDARLSAVMGGKKKVTMFNMNTHITPHLLEKAEKREYQHEAEESDGSDEY